MFGSRWLTCRLGATLLALALAGCGASPGRTPDLTTPAAPSAMRTVTLAAGTVRLRVPDDWSRLDVRAPQAGLFASGLATVALWRYRTTGAVPTDPAQLRAALAALVDAGRARDPSLRVLASAIDRIGGHGAVILDVIARVGSEIRRIRSEHVYLPGTELVLETFAPPAVFARVDRQVFSPVRHSLTLLGPGVTA